MKGLQRIARMTAMVALLTATGACSGDDRTAATPPAAGADAPAAPEATPVTDAAAAAPAAAPADQAAGDAGIPPAQLDAMVAPIALYPDALLMQVLMASTYPTEVVMADRWRRDHADLEGEALDTALADQTWDPSVASLTFFPDVLSRMSQNLEWTTDLGNAFLAHQDDVMNACQRLRAAAQQAGTLETNEQQTVTVKSDVVTIQPTNPEVVYVPQYNTTNVYGSSYQPAPQYYPAVQTGYSAATLATTGLLAFGAGMLTSYALWGGCDWDDHDVYYGGYHGGGNYKGPTYKGPTYNIGGKGDDTININVGGNRQQWQHRPEHRRGVAYQNPRTRDQYASRDPQRRTFDERTARGYDRDANLGQRQPSGSRPAQTRPAGAPKMPPRPAAKPAAKAPAQGTKAAPRPQAAAHRTPTGESTFGGSRNAGVQRQASQRGAASRGRSASPSVARGGGGGGGGRGGGGGTQRGGGRKGR
jgi:hypothetical protein